jgi:hypothetical protein
VLFSRKSIADFINARFEPAWQSVRPSALVRIDFGNGKSVTRTLNGNIATYVCLPDGRVLDVIPGIYDPDAYLARLHEATKLATWVAQQARQADIVIKGYHAAQAQSLRKNKEAKIIVLTPGRSILGIEASMKLVLKSSLRGKASGRIAAEHRPRKETPYTLPADLGSRVGELRPSMLKKDATYNETVRRIKVHEHLAKHAALKPPAMTNWLYKNVLDTDLDDPYLGLGKVLFGTYPFRGENE